MNRMVQLSINTGKKKNPLLASFLILPFFPFGLWGPNTLSASSGRLADSVPRLPNTHSEDPSSMFSGLTAALKF